MKVKELIDQLKNLNQELSVYAYVNEEPIAIDFVDDTLTDRVDLNLMRRKNELQYTKSHERSSS